MSGLLKRDVARRKRGGDDGRCCSTFCDWCAFDGGCAVGRHAFDRRRKRILCWRQRRARIGGDRRFSLRRCLRILLSALAVAEVVCASDEREHDQARRAPQYDAAGAAQAELWRSVGLLLSFDLRLFGHFDFGLLRLLDLLLFGLGAFGLRLRGFARVGEIVVLAGRKRRFGRELGQRLRFAEVFDGIERRIVMRSGKRRRAILGFRRPERVIDRVRTRIDGLRRCGEVDVVEEGLVDQQVGVVRELDRLVFVHRLVDREVRVDFHIFGLDRRQLRVVFEQIVDLFGEIDVVLSGHRLGRARRQRRCAHRLGGVERRDVRLCVFQIAEDREVGLAARRRRYRISDRRVARRFVRVLELLKLGGDVRDGLLHRCDGLSGMLFHFGQALHD